MLPRGDHGRRADSPGGFIPEVRTATTTTANAARIILTVNRFTSGVLVTQGAGRSATAGRITKASTNPWILLGTVAASFVIATAVAVIRTAAATPAPVTSPTPAPSTEPVTSPTPAPSTEPVTSTTPAPSAAPSTGTAPAGTRPARKAAVSRKPAAGRARSQGTGKRRAAKEKSKTRRVPVGAQAAKAAAWAPSAPFFACLGLPLTGIVTSRRDQRAAPPRPVHAGRDAIKVLAGR